VTEPASTEQSSDARPIVRVAAANSYTLWLFAGALILGGLLLFNMLNARRQNMVAATEAPNPQPGEFLSSPPPLALPPTYSLPESAYQTASQGAPPVLGNQPSQMPPPIVARVAERSTPSYSPTPAPVQQLPPSTPAPLATERPANTSIIPMGNSGGQNDRVTAGRLANPAFTVPQGTIISAVLETALDSTRAGAVRAIVSRDVRGFDGSRILIPRGSQIYGDYESDLAAGQKRALVRWQRLTRPDAVIINLDSPAADPLGRAGIKGKVDSHFLERFGGAILQSGLDVGTAVATRSIVDYPVLLALPGNAQASARGPAQVTPVLKVQQGTSVSVFIAHDLDFSTVDR
jgi:type IV secretion system protein VirB10